MRAEAGLARSVRPARPAPHVPLRARLFGLGSVFGKTLRDSRVPMVVVGGLIGFMLLAGGEAMSATYGTARAREELGAMARTMPPVMRGFYGNPVNVETLGGFVSWHYGSYFALLGGLWSILALSSTLAREAWRGSLDLTVASLGSRRLIALQKLGAHVVGVAVVAGAAGVVAWVTGAAFGRYPGDGIGAGAAAAFAIGLMARALVAGAVAFALASLLGRGAAAGIAGAVMVGGYVVYGYRTVVAAFDSIAGATWWSWLAGHVPLAGPTDWDGVAVTLLVAAALFAVGVEVFARRDIGVTVRIPMPAVPGALLGLRGPLGRSYGDVLPGAVSWSVGLAAYGFLMAAASRSLIGLLAESGEMAKVFRELIPGLDITRTPGFLQFAFVDLGLVLVGLAAVTFVAGRWADESEGRLELQLATRLNRARWVAGAGGGAALGIATVTLVLAASLAAGVATAGEDPGTATTGVLALGLFGLAVVGIGIAAGGILGAGAAVPVTLAFVVGTFLLDTLAPILRLPDWVAQLALTTHLGEPLVGRWDQAGVVVCLALAIGGVAAGMWGMSRRDVAG